MANHWDQDTRSEYRRQVMMLADIDYPDEEDEDS